MDCFKIFIAHLNIFSFFIKAKTNENSNSTNLEYDPNKNYEELVWNLICEKRGEDFIKDIDKIVESYNELI